MSALVWRSPPMTRAEQIDAEVAELREQPGVWAVVAEGVTSAKRAEPYHDRGCETRLSTTGGRGAGRRYDVYARWPAGGEL